MFKHIPNPFIPTISDAVVIETGDITTIHVSGQVGHEAVVGDDQPVVVARGTHGRERLGRS